MVPIDGHEGYYLDLKNCDVYSFKKSKLIKIKPLKNWKNSKVYHFYINGIAQKITLFEILLIVVPKLSNNID